MSKYQLGNVPIIKRPRTKFSLNHSYKTMFNAGDLVPFYLEEIYPGDQFKVNSTNVIRTSVPFVRPVMGDMFLDMFYFFVPSRIIYDSFYEVFGENKTGYWATPGTKKMPVISGQVSAGSLADYLGIPAYNYTLNSATFNALPFRAYAQIWNDWFRNENVEAPVYFPTDSTSASFNNNAWSAANYTGKLAKVNKLHDYFTTCLPAPQKGVAPMVKLKNDTGVQGILGLNVPFNDPIKVVDDTDTALAGNHTLYTKDGVLSYNTALSTQTLDTAHFQNLGLTAGTDLFNINDLRIVTQLQRMLERDAEFGTRNIEVIFGHFGVTNPDSRLQRSQFLGGKRMPLKLEQVTQTSESSSNDPLGQVAAFSLSSGQCGFASTGFTEHGFILGVACVRHLHVYQQSIDKLWLRKERKDYYDPIFANVGEQPVYSAQLFNQVAGGTNIFGYNEAWAELRYHPSKITGLLNSSANNGFDIWHFGDEYANMPTLDTSFMTETNIYIDRCLSAPSSTIPNFVIDIYNEVSAIRPLPMYSIPGLLDHN